MVVSRLFAKFMLTFVAEGKLKAQEGTVVIRFFIKDSPTLVTVDGKLNTPQGISVNFDKSKLILTALVLDEITFF